MKKSKIIEIVKRPWFFLVTICGEISQSLLVDCETPLAGGVDTTMYIANKDDIESVTRDLYNPLLISAVTMKAGKKFFKYQGLKGTENSLLPKDDFVRLKYSSGFDHSTTFSIFTIDPASKYEIEQLCKSVVTAIFQNNQRGEDGSSAFEIRGLDVGMEMESLTREPENADTQGAFNIVLKTQKVKEPHLPASIFLTDYATTLALVEGLTV